MTTLIQALETLIADDPSPSRRAILKEAVQSIATQSALVAQMAAALDECEKAAQLLTDLSACGADDEYTAALSQQITAALTAYTTMSPDPQWQRVPEGGLVLHVEQKDGWKVITSPQHLGLYVAHQQEDVAMADVLEAIRTLSKLDAQSKRARGEG